MMYRYSIGGLEMGSLRRLLVVTCVTSALLATSMNTMAYFWSDNPAAYGHDDTPPGGEDGWGIATVQWFQGTPIVSCQANLSGGSEGSPDGITIVDDYWCVWVISYQLHAVYNGEGVRTKVTLELYYKGVSDPSFQSVDTDSASVIADFWDPDVSEEGWLYVWHDVDHQSGDQYKLKATAECEHFVHGGWEDFDGSPYSVEVYFEMQ